CRWTGRFSTFRAGPWFFFSSRRRHTRFSRDWSSDVCSSDLSRRFICRLGSGPSCFIDGLLVRLGIGGSLPHVKQRAKLLKRLSRSEERRVGKESGLGRALEQVRETDGVTGMHETSNRGT